MANLDTHQQAALSPFRTPPTQGSPMRALAAASLALLLSTAARAEDTAAPVIDHRPAASTAAGAKAVAVMAKITDESKVFPQVLYRYGPGNFKSINMLAVKGTKSDWGANVPIAGDLLEYYIEAYDEVGNGPARAGEPEQPFRVDTSGTGGASAAAPPPKPAPKVVEASPPPPKRSEPPPARPKPSPSHTASQSSGGGGRTWTWVAAGTGLGLLAGGLLAGLAVKSADDAYQARLKDPTNGSVSLQQQYDANKSLGTTATLLTISGLVVVGGGVALWFLESPSWDSSSGVMSSADTGHGVIVAGGPIEGGGVLAVAGRF